MAFDLEPLNDLDSAVFGVGLAALHVVRSADRLGHVTLRGHLHYQNEAIYEQNGQPITADYVRWLRWISSWGSRERNELAEPTLLRGLVSDLERAGVWSLGGV